MKIYFIQEPRVNEGKPLLFNEEKSADLIMTLFDEVLEGLAFKTWVMYTMTKAETRKQAKKLIQSIKNS